MGFQMTPSDLTLSDLEGHRLKVTQTLPFPLDYTYPFPWIITKLHTLIQDHNSLVGIDFGPDPKSKMAATARFQKLRFRSITREVFDRSQQNFIFQ